MKQNKSKSNFTLKHTCNLFAHKWTGSKMPSSSGAGDFVSINVDNLLVIGAVDVCSVHVKCHFPRGSYITDKDTQRNQRSPDVNRFEKRLLQFNIELADI